MEDVTTTTASYPPFQHAYHRTEGLTIFNCIYRYWTIFTRAWMVFRLMLASHCTRVSKHLIVEIKCNAGIDLGNSQYNIDPSWIYENMHFSYSSDPRGR